MTENVDIEAVRDFLAEVRVFSERMDAAEAIGWLVVCTDEENGHLHISGPYDAPEEALIAAQRDHESVNARLPEGEPGWKHEVYPLFAAANRGER